MIERPEANEYSNFYKGYIDAVPEGDIVEILKDQEIQFSRFIQDIPQSKLDYAYDHNKWTVKEVIGHITDTERIMASRILRFSREDKTSMPGFDQNEYVARGDFKMRELSSLVNEFHHLRLSNIALISSLPVEKTSNTGEANKVVFSVRALIYILAGHLGHHWFILKEKYLN